MVDGPFAETKEYLGGFNLIEAADMDEAVRIASEFPWTRTGSVEIRPVRDFDAVRRRVGALISCIAAFQSAMHTTPWHSGPNGDGT